MVRGPGPLVPGPWTLVPGPLPPARLPGLQSLCPTQRTPWAEGQGSALPTLALPAPEPELAYTLSTPPAALLTACRLGSFC